MNTELKKMLTDFVQLEDRVAGEIAKKLRMDEFQRIDWEMYALFEEQAYDIMRESEVLRYNNSDLDEYLSLLPKAAERLTLPNGNVAEDLVAENIEAFSTTETLRAFIKGDVPVKSSYKVNPQPYRILHLDNEQSQNYLSSLIKNHCLRVGDHEHWRKSSKHTGTRGTNILIKIAKELVEMFEEAGLEGPGYEINHGQKELIIDEQTAENLRHIRDKTYKLD